SPVFDGKIETYTSVVNYDVAELSVKITKSDANAEVQVNGTIVHSNPSEVTVPLLVGKNKVVVKVTAPDGITVKTYIIEVTRKKTKDIVANIIFGNSNEVLAKTIIKQSVEEDGTVKKEVTFA